jgi:hypothetical protein
VYYCTFPNNKQNAIKREATERKDLELIHKFLYAYYRKQLMVKFRGKDHQGGRSVNQDEY